MCHGCGPSCDAGTKRARLAFEDGQVGFCQLHPKVHKLFGLCVGDRVWTEGGD